MMNYEIFKEVLAEKFLDYMPAEYQNMKLEIHPVDKVNVTLDGLNLITEGDTRVTPTIYINDIYAQYQKNNDLQEVLQTAANRMEKAIKEAPDIVTGIEMDSAKNNIVFQLVNTEQNKDMLQNVPNRAFQDLSIIYRWVVKTDAEGIQSTVIHDSLAERLGLSEEQMFQLAVDNTRRLFPPSIKSMNDVIREMFAKDGMPAEVADMMIGEMPPEQTMWIISNERGINGAISMLYEDKLHGLAEELETDLYIMPSSLHEVIAVSVSMGDPNELAQMVAEINMDQVALDERLSNQVYHYDKDLRKLSLATDTPNKRLDGIVGDTKLIYDSKEKSR
ncbi:hypothetical protein acsn021_39200 [Anaerocolumna cellulosilytica]|uniref:Uncharacterized protein n=1 Tax=Anaerocolumna cellulosilytica TaxID=433286 RepID=A0A6S6RC75_9FIRM|nr:DUF5688 family protein [Anaerocolumna cellulosilytica]MBB5196323.1 hypothetical protein [Anaerocolumna cellulosilytica]BCJ96351.1 hypothetical protein acsn021_39200 [Anaerocolumna cellulosilytica]